MSQLTDAIRELIRSRNITEEEYAQRMVDLGCEREKEPVFAVLNDEVIPCHDLVWGTEEVLALDKAELTRLQDAAYEDVKERVRRGRTGPPGTSLASTLAFAIMVMPLVA